MICVNMQRLVAFLILSSSLALPPETSAKDVVDLRVSPFEPGTSLIDMLPIPPKDALARLPSLEDLARMPEVFFQDPGSEPVLPNRPRKRLEALKRVDISKRDIDRLRKKFGNISDKEIDAKLDEEAARRAEAEERIAYQIARVHQLNGKKTDYFLDVLRENRPDVAGLPFVMGKACRLSETAHKRFSAAVLLVQASLGPPQEDPANFWKFYDDARAAQIQSKEPHVAAPQGRDCVAALMQMLPVESLELQLSMIERLPKFDQSGADKSAVTIALAKQAVFAQEAALRRAALAQLQKRDTAPATDILLRGLRYPWVGIAQNAADAIAVLGRKDLSPELAKLLKEPDPRAPVLADVQGTKVHVVREVVRVNHLRNCLLCHPPVAREDVAEKLKLADLESKEDGRRSRVNFLDVKEVVGAVPPPGLPLPESDPNEHGGGYGAASRDILIRADVTYLRQDFSLVLPVPNAAPWPEMQRFDFLVRSRVLSVEDARNWQAALTRNGSENPYRQAADAALRRLAGVK